MKKTNTIPVILILLVLLLAACKSPAPDSTSEADSKAVFTAAALTAQAKGQQIIATTPAVTSQAGTPTASTPEAEPTTQATQSSSDTSAPQEVKDLAEFVDDISIPDGTKMPPGATFIKTWLLKNAGTTTWTPDYQLVFVGGDRMNAPDSIPINKSVPPDQTVEISVELVAPQSEANYTGYFNLQNTIGNDFGVGVGGIEAFWVDIIVSEGAEPVASPTPAVSPEVVTQNFLYVDDATADQCPHTYHFTSIISLSAPAEVTYGLEAEFTNPGVTVDLPEPVTVQLGAGSHTFEYDLTFTSALNGSVVLHIISPGDHYSNIVNLTLNCN